MVTQQDTRLCEYCHTPFFVKIQSQRFCSLRCRTRPKKTEADRFWPKVEKNGPTPDYRPGLGPCWLWTGSRDTLGYGKFRPFPFPTTNGSTVHLAHRWAYETLVGAIPDGLQLDHLCRNPRCVNPVHLEPVTHRENILRGVGPTAINARKTHCPAGHQLTPETLTQGDFRRGIRKCRICARRAESRYRKRRRAAKRLAQALP